MVRFAYHETPLGVARIGYEDGAVVSLGFTRDAATPDAPCALTDAAFAALDACLRGERAAFTFPVRPEGTAFQRAVWAALAAIPRGETRTYGELARALGRPRAARAVGAACGANPIAVLIPCHRAVGARGALTGYAWGLARKAALLRLEAEGAAEAKTRG
jgi:methylated-DNA-[protein]-cysteine S-methyltransferase